MNSTNSNQEESCILPVYARVTGIVLITLIMAIGTIGNIAVCVIITIFKRSFETVSHFFVINVAISDLLTCLTVLPFDIIYWLNFPVFPLGSDICRLWNAFYFGFLTASSIALTLISIDIYLAVTMPLHYQMMVTKGKAFLAIGIGWLWSITTGVLIFIFQEKPPEGEYLFDLNPIAYGLYLAIHILLPSLVIPVFYAKIFMIARKHELKITPQASTSQQTSSRESRASKSGFKSTNESGVSLKRQLSMAKTFFFITMSFFLCWYPFFVVQLIYVFKLDGKVDWCRLETADTIVCWLSYLQCCLNPVFYVFRRKNIRRRIFNRFKKHEYEGNNCETTKYKTTEA